MDHPFDIEQDNNPTDSTHILNQYDKDLLNNSISVANKLELLLQDANFDIHVQSTEKLINSSVIVYLIQITNDQNTITIKRRYSEFKSLRDNLCKLYPTVIIPPIPSKHSIFKYLINSLDSQQEVNLINFRVNYFNRFLKDLLTPNRIYKKHYKQVPHHHDSPQTHETGITNAHNINFRNQIIVKKFLDPNYELCWYNVLNEPPLNQLPRNYLLCNPLDPLDQNGLYILLPKLKNFTNDLSEIHNLNLDDLGKLNDSLLKLGNQIKFYKFAEPEFKLIPKELIDFEVYCHSTVKVVNYLNKLNMKHNKNFRLLLAGLINLGGNLNNFSLEVFELNKQLSNYIEKFGSIVDLNYLNYESFLLQHLVPDWQESINQLIHYYEVVLDITGFYKFKVIQFLILYKLKFEKMNQLKNLGDGDNFENLKHIDSPSVNNFLKNKVRRKGSWYNMFGGNQRKMPDSNIISSPPDSTNSAVEVMNPSESISEINGHLISSTPPEISQTLNTKRVESLENELNKIDQLIHLASNDLTKLNQELIRNFTQFQKFVELKWCIIIIEFIKSAKQLFIENLNNWTEFRRSFD